MSPDNHSTQGKSNRNFQNTLSGVVHTSIATYQNDRDQIHAINDVQSRKSFSSPLCGKIHLETFLTPLF